MARARTGTKAKSQTSATTRTKTTRLSHIKMQLRLLLERAVTVSSSSLAKIATGVEKHIISKIHLDAEDAEGLCYARLSLEVDWDEHHRQLELGHTQIEIDKEDQMELEVDAAVEAFNEVVECGELTPSWSVSYRSGVDHQWADGLLGFRDSAPLKWVGPTTKKMYRVRRLSELKVGLELADDD